MTKALSLLLPVVLLAVACDSEVSVETPTTGTGASAGSGAASSGSGSGGGGTGGGGATGGGGGGAGGAPACDVLLADLDAKIREARVCSPDASLSQCDGSKKVLDRCECAVHVNEDNPAAVAAASAASAAAMAAGCTGPCESSCLWDLGTALCSPTKVGPYLCTPYIGD